MSFFTKHLRLFLIIAMVISPMQPLFAAQKTMQIDMQTDVSVVVVAATADTNHKDALMMLDGNCGKHGNCQSSAQCNSCPLSPGIPQTKLNRVDPGCAQIQFTISAVSLYSTDLLPEYRPPRYS
jgi:hypothetical protein